MGAIVRIEVISGVGVAAASFVAMELLAAIVHRFVMHGPGWRWHRSHHSPHGRLFEANDLYAVGFAIIAVVLFLAGGRTYPLLGWAGAGMSAYGLVYALVHDGLVHRRLPGLPVPRRGYLKRLVQAHRLHHAVSGRDGCVSFGFLYAAPPRRLRARLRARR